MSRLLAFVSIAATCTYMVLSTWQSNPVQAAALDSQVCQSRKTEQTALGSETIREHIAKGPVWAKDNLTSADLDKIKRWIELEEDLLFRCGAGNGPMPQLAGGKPPPLPVRKTKLEDRPVTVVQTTKPAENPAKVAQSTKPPKKKLGMPVPARRPDLTAVLQDVTPPVRKPGMPPPERKPDQSAVLLDVTPPVRKPGMPPPERKPEQTATTKKSTKT